MNKQKYKFEIDAMTVFILNMIGNLLSYLYQIIIARKLDINDYGSINFIYSLLIIFSIPASIIGIVTCKYTAEFASKNDFKKEAETFKMGFALLIAVQIILTPISWVILALVYEINICICLIIVFSSFFANINVVTLYFVQGREQFITHGIMNIIVYLLRLAGGLLVLNERRNVEQIIIVTSLAWLISSLYGIVRNKEIFKEYLKLKLDFRTSFCDWKPMLISILYMNLGLQLMLNIDNILVKKYFTEIEVGNYMAANTLARVSMYATTALVTVMLPKVAKIQFMNKNSFTVAKSVIKYSAFLMCLVDFGLIVCSDYVIKILFGAKYQDASIILRQLIIFIFPLSILSILVNYSLVTRSAGKVGKMIIFLALIEIIVVSKVHETVLEMIIIMSVMVVIACGLVVFIIKKEEKRGIDTYEKH